MPDGRTLSPPIYGHARAGRDATVPAPGEPPDWLRKLNLDPRYRGAAALGTRVVQELQEQLVAAAWDQAGQLERRVPRKIGPQLVPAPSTAPEL